MNTTQYWRLKDWLQAGANLAIILGAIAGASWWVISARANAIDATREALVRTWTNEGDILSTETRFVTLALQDYEGDVIGTLSGPGFDEMLDVKAEIGWFNSALELTQLRGRTLTPVARVKVKITGNDNRLEWQLEGSDPDYLPETTTLWPSSGPL